MSKIFIYLKNLDWLLFFTTFLLTCFGLTEIYSIALGRGTVDLVNFEKQAVFIIIGLACFFFFSFLDYNFLKNSSKYLYFFTIVSLFLVLFLGKKINGTRGWFSLAGLGLQPTEFAKIVLIIFLSYFFSFHPIKIRSLKQFAISGLISLSFFIPVFIQPDFGSALIFLAIWLAMLFWSGFSKKYFIIISLAIVLIGGSLWIFYFKDYQKQRILTFVNPAANTLSQGYNVNQALIAVGSGGIAGRGVGFGSQSQLKFLPEAQNDFIFSVISEELGFLGVSLVLLFYGIFFYRCFRALPKINNDFGIFFISGTMSLIFIQMFVNIGMNIGILPVVGITLPFISYGGSSIVSTFILIGIVENIIIKSKINY